MRDDRERIVDMLEAIERIQRYDLSDQAMFDHDELLQTWVIHHLQILGEAARATSAAFRERHTTIPWKQIIGMRTLLVHHYFEIDLDAVWLVVVRDLAQLKPQLQAVLDDPSGTAESQ